MTDWKLSGTYFETCNCDAACPCVMLSAPSQGECTALIAWHIDKGHFDSVSLNGLNVAVGIYAPGTMVETKWKVVAFFDDKADLAQNDALHKIFGGKAGGHPAVLASFFDEVVGCKDVPMNYSNDGKSAKLTIPGSAEAEIEGIEGQGGAPITISNHPLCVAPGEPAVVARSKHFSLKDFGWDWSMSEKNGFLSDFAYSSAA